MIAGHVDNVNSLGNLKSATLTTVRLQ